MLNNFNLFQNIGQFDSAIGSALPLAKLSLLYAENGRGKTTTSAILRSLATNNGQLIAERHRLGATHVPRVVIQHAAGNHIFVNGAWNTALSNLMVFDDDFVSTNVCSGLEVVSDHKAKLHELILGANGVALNRALQVEVDNIEEHNRQIREKASNISPHTSGAISVDNFCELGEITDVDDVIASKERERTTALAAQEIGRQQEFGQINLPRFDLAALNALLSTTVEDIDDKALANVTEHFSSLGKGGENWIETGLYMIPNVAAAGDEHCPFCLQNVQGLEILNQYRAYFGVAYRGLKKSIKDEIASIEAAYGASAYQQTERSILTNERLRTFWERFFAVPALPIPIEQIQQTWTRAKSAIDNYLANKQASPLERLIISEEHTALIQACNDLCDTIANYSLALQQSNINVTNSKQTAASANLQQIDNDLLYLRLAKLRYRTDVNTACAEYNQEKARKVATEARREAARQALDQYRQTVFPQYETAINRYLSRFNAGFSIGSVASVNNRGGSSCNYSVVINNTNVELNNVPGRPSFKNTLSAGDRNVLALAFFFASIDVAPNGGADKIVVIDDPMTSLDEHRSLVTVQQIIRLAQRVEQVLVLSHSKQFLFDLNESAHASRVDTSAIRLTRVASGSGFSNWDISRDAITAHDRHHEMLNGFIHGTMPGLIERDIAISLRPVLERFMRVSYPLDFPPGSLLGPFIYTCNQRIGQANELLSATDTQELRDILDYANQFHHDSNANAGSVVINSTELLQFSRRTLLFARR